MPRAKSCSRSSSSSQRTRRSRISWRPLSRGEGPPGRAQRNGQDAGEGVAFTLDRAARARARRPRARGHARRDLGCARGPAVQRRGGRSARGASARRSRQRVATRCPYRCAGRSPWRPDERGPGPVRSAAERPGTGAADHHSCCRSGGSRKSPAGAETTPGFDGTARNTGPLELPRLLPAFDRGSDEALGLAMLAALQGSKGRSSIRPDILRPRLAKYPESVQQKGEALLASLNVDAARQKQRLEELLAAGKREAMSGADKPCSTVRRWPVCRATRLGIWAARSAPT